MLCQVETFLLPMTTKGCLSEHPTSEGYKEGLEGATTCSARAITAMSRTGSHLLKRSIAMTMMMINITARTGPITHSISGSSCCFAEATSITISSE